MSSEIFIKVPLFVFILCVFVYFRIIHSIFLAEINGMF